MKIFKYGSKIYKYNLLREVRKTLSLTVKPNLDIILKVPSEADQDNIDSFLEKKWMWLDKQLRYFKKHHKNIYQKEYISGESIWYLGRQYELLVRSSIKNSVSIDKTRFYIYSKYPTDETISNKLIVNNWLRARRREVFYKRFEEMKTRFQYNKMPTLIIRDMSKRWGSFISESKIVLNPKLIHVSTECIDYVIVHELCHIKYKNHSKQYFEYLSEKLPHWEIIKGKLELSVV